jgi:hypothetical protein
VNGVGASAIYIRTDTAHDITVKVNDKQMTTGLAHTLTEGNARVNTFGADNTDRLSGERALGWRLRILANDVLSSDPTGNILRANLGHVMIINEDKIIATLSLGVRHGTSNADYGRAFARGNDFKIYIGGQAAPETHEFSLIAPNEKINVANIIDAISKGKEFTGTTNCSLIVNSDWRVNTFGFMEDLETITLRGNSALNFDNAASSMNKIEIERGKVHIRQITNLNDIIGNVKMM